MKQSDILSDSIPMFSRIVLTYQGKFSGEVMDTVAGSLDQAVFTSRNAKKKCNFEIT